MRRSQSLNEIISECFVVGSLEDGNPEAIVTGKSFLSAEPKVTVPCLRQGANGTLGEPILNCQGRLNKLGYCLLGLERNAGEQGHRKEHERTRQSPGLSANIEQHSRFCQHHLPVTGPSPTRLANPFASLKRILKVIIGTCGLLDELQVRVCSMMEGDPS
jgi:hypothetical protein